MALRGLLHPGYRLNALASPHIEILSHLFNLSNHLCDEIFTLLLQLFLDRRLTHQSLPSLKLPHQLSGGACLLRENLFSKLLAYFFLYGLKHSLVEFALLFPSLDEDLIGVERIDFSKWVKEAFDFHLFLLF